MLSILIGIHYGYNTVISTQPIERDIQIPESATRKLVEQHAHEHHRVGNISYLTTGTTLYFFEYGCEPGIFEYYVPGGPSCLHFGFDEPGKVQLEIPRYLIDEFPVIDQVYHGDHNIFGKQIPFQVINDEDNPYVTVRIDVPFNYTIFTVSGRSGGLFSIPASGGNPSMMLVYSFLSFWLFFILYVVSKQLAVVILNKVRHQ
jgi:hypothetical protein